MNVLQKAESFNLLEAFIKFKAALNQFLIKKKKLRYIKFNDNEKYGLFVHKKLN